LFPEVYIVTFSLRGFAHGKREVNLSIEVSDVKIKKS